MDLTAGGGGVERIDLSTQVAALNHYIITWVFIFKIILKCIYNRSGDFRIRVYAIAHTQQSFAFASYQCKSAVTVEKHALLQYTLNCTQLFLVSVWNNVAAATDFWKINVFKLVYLKLRNEDLFNYRMIVNVFFISVRHLRNAQLFWDFHFFIYRIFECYCYR